MVTNLGTMMLVVPRRELLDRKGSLKEPTKR
jgi:hypothetical protein